MKRNKFNPFNSRAWANPQEQEVQVSLEQQQQQQPDGDPEPQTKISFLGEAHSELGIDKPPVPQDPPSDPPKQDPPKDPPKQDPPKEDPPKQDPKPEEKPIFERDKKPAKQKPEESIANLRKAKDEAEARYKTLSDEIKGQLGTDDVTVLKPVVEYLSKRLEGVITPEKVAKLIEDFDSGDERIKTYEEKLAEREKRLRDYDIRQSEEFQTKYEKPWREAQNSLFYEFANVTPDKKLIAPKATNSLFEKIAKDPNIDAPTMKAALREFEINYEKESGEKTTVPSLTDMMKAHRNFQETRVQMQKAYEDWEVNKIATQKELKLKQAQEAEVLQSKGKKERVKYVTEAFRNFNHDDFEGIMEEDEIKELFDEEYKFTESYWEKSEPPLTMDKLYQRGVNDRILQKILPEYKELKKFKEEYDKANSNEIKGSGGGGGKGQKQESKSFLGEAEATLHH